MFLSIEMIVHFVFNARMEFKEQNQLDDNGIDSLMQWSRLLNIGKAQLIMLSTSKFYLMEQCPILQFTLMILSARLIIRQHLLN